MMTGKVVLTQLETRQPLVTNSTISQNATQLLNPHYTATDIATSVTFVVAAYQVFFGKVSCSIEKCKKNVC